MLLQLHRLYSFDSDGMVTTNGDYVTICKDLYLKEDLSEETEENHEAISNTAEIRTGHIHRSLSL